MNTSRRNCTKSIWSAAAVTAAILLVACSNDTENTTVLVTPDNPISSVPVSTTPATEPVGFVADDPVLTWLVHADTRAARDHLTLIGNYLVLIEAGITDDDEADICRGMLPEVDPVPVESAAAGRAALGEYPVPGSPLVDLYLSVYELFPEYLAICAEGDVADTERALLRLEHAATLINPALAEDRS